MWRNETGCTLLFGVKSLCEVWGKAHALTPDEKLYFELPLVGCMGIDLVTKVKTKTLPTRLSLQQNVPCN
jgi:hypothetical protein